MHSTTESPNVKQCEYCGKPLPADSHPSRKYCDNGDECQRAANRALDASRKYGPFVCKCCGEVYWADRPNRNTFKNREHAFRYRKEQGYKRECPDCGAMFRCGVHENSVPNVKCDGCKQKDAPIAYEKHCEICGGRLSTFNDAQMLCGDRKCLLEKGRRKSRQLEERKHREAGKVCKCKQCGCLFCPLYGNKRIRHCSDECQDVSKRQLNRASKKRIGGNLNGSARKRLRLFYGDNWRAYYRRLNRSKIYDRDKWKCYRCGVKLNRKYISPWHDANATIDHVIPLAKGGSHTYENCRACCARCNSDKSDKLDAPVQLRLGVTG